MTLPTHPTQRPQYPLEPFITGSRAYGNFNSDSDIDLVLPPTQVHILDTLEILSDTGEFPVKYGKLNLILTRSEFQFSVWKEGTEQLIKMTPVTREQAIAHFNKLFASYGLSKSIADSGRGKCPN